MSMSIANKNIEILIVGAGGVGAYFGGRLAQGGATVSVVCRSDYEYVKNSGFDIKSINGDFIFKPEQVCRTVQEYTGDPDFIIISLKALPEIDIPEMIVPVVRDKSAIVLLQNGIDIEHYVHDAYPNNELISGIAYIGVSRRGKGIIEHQGGGTLSIGLFPEGESDSVSSLCRLWVNAGVECMVSNEIIRKRWEKLLWNVPFNSISVLAGNRNTKEIMSDVLLVDLAEKMMWEVVKVSESCGVGLDHELVEWNLEYTRNFPPYKSSMLLDYENGRKMESDAILGNVLKLAKQNSVVTPHIETVFALLNSRNKQ